MAVKTQIKVVIDTNLWISFLITNKYLELNEMLLANRIRVLFCTSLLEEFLNVVARPKLRRYFSGEDVENLLYSLKECTDYIEVKSKIVMCRDPKDDFLLALAKDGRADYLLTGDVDLLAVKNLGRTKIITYAEFLLLNL